MNNQCLCGCGLETTIIKKTNLKEGRLKGNYNRYVKGHWSKANRVFISNLAKNTIKVNGNPMHKIDNDKKNEWKRKLSLSMKGRIAWNKGIQRPDMWLNKHPSWKGGRGYSDGYIILTIKPCTQVKEHRYIIENSIGRKLRSDEVVHHINGNKSDNKLENLMVMDNREHSRLHREMVVK